MQLNLSLDALREGMEAQAALALIATTDEVRAMHEDLALLYSSQLACMLATDRVARLLGDLNL